MRAHLNPERSAEEFTAEQQLIQRVLAGESQCFHDLIRPYERRVYLAAFSILRREDEAEDAAQDAVIKAFTHLRQFRFEARFSTWLTSIVINEARHRLRSQKNQKTESLDAEPEEQSFSPAVLADWRELPSEVVERKEVREMLRNAVAGLPDIYRIVFSARDIEGLNVNETAVALGISADLVKVRLHRARMMLQRTLTPLLKGAAPKSNLRLRWF